jgi:uncharacterized RDD family membrane protein YckC
VSDQTDPYAPPPEGGQSQQSPYATPSSPSGATQPPPYGAPAWDALPSAAGYASWGRRVGGRVIDGLCVIVPAAIIGGVAGSRGIYQLVAFIGTLIIGYINGATGQSPGKRVAGIRLIRESDAGLIGGGLGMVRELLHILDTLALLLGWLWPLWDKKRQTFADKIMGTVVVRT